MKFLIDPHAPPYDNNQFFNLDDKFLNRDNGLAPFVRLKEDLEKKGFEVCTFDLALNANDPSQYNGSYYLSFGRLRDTAVLRQLQVKPYGFIIMEPPLIKSKPYKLLPELTSFFENVFIHNTTGDGYDIQRVTTSKLKRLYWPQPFDDVLEKYWNRQNRELKVVMINAKHRQRGFSARELYSQRIKWCLALNKFLPVDIYGRGWADFFSKNSVSISYVLNYFGIQKIYKGPCESKFEVMSRYDFALCFENFIMDGYITEKIFDCFYSGVIPVYWGGDHITQYIPEKCFIDLRRFKDAKALALHLKALTPEQKSEYRENARQFIKDPQNRLYYDLFKSLNLDTLK